MSEESAYQRQFCDETEVLGVLEAREGDCSDRIEELRERREGLVNALIRLDSIDGDGSDEVVTMRYREEFANAVTPLAGPSYGEHVERREFLAELMAVCGLSLPEARGVLQTALARGFWVEYSRGALLENSNVNPARREPPDLAIDGEDYDSRAAFFEHLRTEYPRREEVEQ